MTKRLSKSLTVLFMSVVMVFAAVVPAFAADIVLIEDHSVVDCTHYYKNNGNYYFQIKCPKGELDKVTVALTSDDTGSGGGFVIPFGKQNIFTGICGKEFAYSDDKYEYNWLIIKCSEYPENITSSWGGVGVKIFYFDGENSKMATNTSNYSTTQGRGYWLSA
ncbi:MAG: hypothetical protein SOY57_04965 [Ruminococcus bromii]|nr:hypothetical protein [Ruminococcus bromii]